MSRKYRQPGYQDGGGGQGQEDRPKPRRRAAREGPRSPRMMGFQAVMRCSKCGASMPRSMTEIKPDSTCPSCRADLHTCRNCVYFDTSARFECTQPISERVAGKNAANLCSFFEARTRVEKKTSSVSQAPSNPLDAREAFERLFKK